jgi:hypothetical protein
MNGEADERILRDGLRESFKMHDEPVVHIRRTLDQYYYTTSSDTADRDKDQVLSRRTRHRGNSINHTTKVLMVDQLWLWILDESRSWPSLGAVLRSQSTYPELNNCNRNHNHGFPETVGQESRITRDLPEHSKDTEPYSD